MLLIDKIFSTVLWILFGHWSQAFDWLGFYVWVSNDFRCDTGILRSLILMPLFRWMGDGMWKVLNTFEVYKYLQDSIPSIFWYAGEIIGDTYLPCLAWGMTRPNEKFNRFIILFGFISISGSKIANVCWRFTGASLNVHEDVYFRNISFIDSVTCFAGVVNDLCCSYVIYRKSSRVVTEAKMKSTPLIRALQSIKNSCLVRIAILTVFKTINAIFYLSNPCLETITYCKWSFLREILITVDYQFYYFDYLLTKQHRPKQLKPTNVNEK
ncbi:hypothetical protein BC833DRAFT_618303 [Globomyces pollinis-pini]|nr:hypothetical protein BC833DRAFT_618303 [Globomyces pollinis-pini]